MISLKNTEMYDEEMIQDINNNGILGTVEDIINKMMLCSAYLSYEEGIIRNSIIDSEIINDQLELDRVVSDSFNKELSEDVEELKQLIKNYRALLPQLNITEYNKLVSNLRSIARNNDEYKSYCQELIKDIDRQVGCFIAMDQNDLQTEIFKRDTTKGLFH